MTKLYQVNWNYNSLLKIISWNHCVNKWLLNRNSYLKEYNSRFFVYVVVVMGGGNKLLSNYTAMYI